MSIGFFSSGSYNVQVVIRRCNIFIKLLVLNSPYCNSTSFLLIDQLQVELIHLVILTNFSIEDFE
ncbi:hypothetical protein JHK85_004928 [Glycine max]|nr:hypothetical protein JHK87_004593 [Glycine soja]KAG5063745.1 hypothetical protein JHK85_004928 [Glycine max]KAG5080698.1 hypothetical protein JHK86_004763 [Glycine max]